MSQYDPEFDLVCPTTTFLYLLRVSLEFRTTLGNFKSEIEVLTIKRINNDNVYSDIIRLRLDINERSTR